MDRIIIFLAAIKNGFIWLATAGTVGDISLFVTLNLSLAVGSQLTSLGIPLLWIFIIWPAVIFSTAVIVAAEQEYRVQSKKESISNELDVLGLNQYWRDATNYLCALDIMINRKRKAFGLIAEATEKESETFKERFEALILEIKKGNKDLGKTLKDFAKKLWEIRTPIVHYGRVPNKKELDIIKTTTENIIKALSEV